ncbi:MULTISPECIES: relaxase/mobilization nuclease domain-containing protein [Myroides]|uniref:relaxase/mobilization nuclease domain-containing protein n=2 Tax=Pseudomonadati TaxID=3379134 RepID=UPI002577FBB2|nr:MULTISPECIES: relaxase/mobilization nuclease domain-containing protein [Myroides]MDM1036329.1 relaxase/mobilization nuclease domain-containing protein [Myroides odoratimimus]MDM1039853.1 relaxase/mobilization nuclease domain-containing protein [Myroides odoratimimus]MDM1060904.1 relaxase/mobilization nuclease domain-containing protein [Myroides odoratimimus]MDM1384597.1 relaxase/mobilization nuclease domain-containing protein [Myroides marinus]
MVSVANATKGSSQAIDYIMNDKGQAFELDRNYVMGENGQDILSEFREVQSLNTRCEKNTYSIVLSPDAAQVKFSKDELLQLTRDHLKNLGLENNQYIAYVHNSTNNQHVHIIANRIDFEGIAHKDNLISKRAQESAEKLAKERGLFTALEVKQMKKEMTKDLRQEISKAYTQCKNKATSIEHFQELMHKKGYDVNLTINKQGNIQGFRIVERQTGQDFKASEIGKNVRFADLTKKIEENKQTIQQAKAILQTPKIANRLPQEIMKQVPPTLNVALDIAIKVVEYAKELVQTLSRGHGIGM